MSKLSDKDLLLFDGDCGICTWCADWAKAHDRKGRFEVKPYYEISEAELARYNVTWEDCTNAVHLIERDGKVRRGAFVVNAFLWRLPGWNLLVALLYVLFPLLLVEMAAYAIVAKNRHKISAKLGMNACRVRFAEDEGDEPTAGVGAEA